MKILEIGPGDNPLIRDSFGRVPSFEIGEADEYHAIQPDSYGGSFRPLEGEYKFPEDLIGSPGVHFQPGDASTMDYADESFDLVFAANVLTDPRVINIGHRIVSQSVRVLKSGCELVLLDNYTPEDDYVTKKIEQITGGTLALETSLWFRTMRDDTCEREEWMSVAGEFSWQQREFGSGGSLHRFVKS